MRAITIMPGSSKTRTAPFLTSFLLLSSFATPALAQIAFDLPAQPLAQALKTLAMQADLNIYFDPPAVRGIHAPAVKATLTAENALSQLLAGTNLRAIRVDETTIRVVQDERSPPTKPRINNPPEHQPAAPHGPSHARAAPAPQPQPHSNGDDPPQSQLEEIVVTAERRRAPIIDTPVSISVLTANTLSEIGAVSFSGFAGDVPGLSYTTTGAGYTQISIRGVTSGFFPGPTVAIYVNDVPYGSSSAFAQAGQLSLDVGLFDLDRVDVLRGPQGTLYGASAMGGLIKYVTTPPNIRHYSSKVHGSASSINDGGASYNAALAVNAPIIPGKAALRTSLYYYRDGGYVYNVAINRSDVDQSRIYGGRLDLLLLPTEGLRVRFTGFLQNISRNGDATVDYRINGTPFHGPLDQYRRVTEPFHQQYRLVSVEVGYGLSGASLTSISSYQTARTNVEHDLSGAYVPLLASFGLPYSALGFPISYFTDKFTQEIRATSTHSGVLDWLSGAFFTREVSGNLQLFAPFDLSGRPAPNALYTYSAPSTFEESALYGDLTLHLSRQLAATVGIRYASNRQRYTQYGSGLLIASEPARSSHDHVFTYLANALYHLDSDTTAYVRFATGYRPGGPNAVANDPVTGLPLAQPTFASDRLYSYEAGFKGQSGHGRFSIDLDAYYIDWRNIQITTVRNGFGVISNAPGGATVRGSELSITARPLGDLTVSGAFAYQDPRISRTNTDLGATTGERLPNVPPVTATASANYQMRSLPFSPQFGGSFRYVGSRSSGFINGTSLPPYSLPSYTDLSLHTAVTVSSWRVQLFVHNALDSRGQVSAFTGYSAPGTAAVALIPPRTIGVTATGCF